MNDDVTVLTDIPLAFDRKRFGREIRLESYPELEAEVDRYVGAARAVARPKAVYAVVYVEARDGSRVTIDGQRFQSDVLAANLSGINRVFAYIATCGAELDALDLSPFDPFASFWHATFKTMALDAAYRHLGEHLRNVYGEEKLSIMNPGSGNVDTWPIEQQRQLFALLGDTEELIGVRLTESFLMVPDKTTSGILFASDVHYVNCHSCEREICPDRRAPFAGAAAGG